MGKNWEKIGVKTTIHYDQEAIIQLIAADCDCDCDQVKADQKIQSGITAMFTVEFEGKRET